MILVALSPELTLHCRFFLHRFSVACNLFCAFFIVAVVTPCLVVTVQPCMEWIPIKKKVKRWVECRKSDTISNLWGANKSSVELFRNDLCNLLKCCTVTFDKNRHNSIEAPLKMPLRQVKDNVTVSFSVENQGN